MTDKEMIEAKMFRVRAALKEMEIIIADHLQDEPDNILEPLDLISGAFEFLCEYETEEEGAVS